MAGVEATAAKRKQALGDLAKVNLESKTAVLNQVRALPVPTTVKMSSHEVERARADLAGYFRPVTRLRAGAPVPQTMTARILSLECLEPSKQLEIGKDEI